MLTTETTAQILGVLGLIFAIISFQEKENKKFFIWQGLDVTPKN